MGLCSQQDPYPTDEELDGDEEEEEVEDFDTNVDPEVHTKTPQWFCLACTLNQTLAQPYKSTALLH